MESLIALIEKMSLIASVLPPEQRIGFHEAKTAALRKITERQHLQRIYDQEIEDIFVASTLAGIDTIHLDQPVVQHVYDIVDTMLEERTRRIAKRTSELTDHTQDSL